MAVRTMKFHNGTSRIITPDLTPEEYQKRFEALKKATAKFLRDAERDRKAAKERREKEQREEAGQG